MKKKNLKHVHILENVVNVCIINDLSYPPATYPQIIRMHFFNHQTHRTRGLSTAPADQGCQVFATKPAQLLLKTSPIAFRGGFPGKNRIPGSKIHIFRRGSSNKICIPGLNITLLGSLQPEDMKNNLRQQC